MGVSVLASQLPPLGKHAALHKEEPSWARVVLPMF